MNDDHDNKISFTRIMIISMWSTPWSYSYTKKKGARGVWKHSKEATGKKKTRIANYRLPDHSWEITLTILPPRVVMARRNITLLSIKLLRGLYEPSHVFEVWRIAKSIWESCKIGVRYFYDNCLICLFIVFIHLSEVEKPELKSRLLTINSSFSRSTVELLVTEHDE